MLFQTAFAPELIHGCRPSPLPSYHTFEQSKERARSAAPLLRTATARGSKPGAVQQTHPKRQGTSASEEAQAPRQANTCLCQFPAINRSHPLTPARHPGSLHRLSSPVSQQRTEKSTLGSARIATMHPRWSCQTPNLTDSLPQQPPETLATEACVASAPRSHCSQGTSRPPPTPWCAWPWLPVQPQFVALQLCAQAHTPTTI